jgi:perosamine synthetase
VFPIRFLPAAVTPIGISDILVAWLLMRKGLIDFESKLAQYFSKRYAYTFGSLMRTTYACFVGLKSVSDRRKVVLPRYSCPSFAHGVIAAGLEIEYCDIDPLTLAIDMNSLSRVNMNQVLAVVCTNLFGLTSEVDSIVNFCKPFGAFVVEGVDYGIGTEYKSRRIGSWGDVAILNFQEGKALPVGGGAVVTDLPIFKSLFGGLRGSLLPNPLKMLGFSVFSRPSMYWILMSASQFTGFNRKKLSMEDTIRKTSSETDFHFSPIGYDRSISQFQGRLGCIVMKRLEIDLECRNDNAQALSTAVAKFNCIQIIRKLDAVNKVHFIRLPILVGGGNRDQLLARLLNKGIEASPMYVEHGLRVDREAFPGAAQVANELLTLPCHPFLKNKDFELVRDVFSSMSMKD